MSVAAAGADGGMGGSDDGNGGEEKKWKGKMEIHSSLPSDDEDVVDDDDLEEGDCKVKRRGSIECLASLEQCLPMKRGLSSHYHGKARSFDYLMKMPIEDSKDLGKKEYAINKRRRLLISHELRDKQLHDGAISKLAHASSLPAVLPDHRPNEGEEEKDDKRDCKKGSDNKNREEDGK